MNAYRWGAGVMTFLLLCQQATAAMPMQGRFSDVDTSSSFNDAVYYLRNHGVVSGYEDGTFKPERAVSRAEFLKMVLKAAERNIPVNVHNQPFPDVVMSSWYAPYVREAIDVGIIDGYPDGKFYPDRTVSRVEAIKMLLLANYIAEKDLPNVSSFADVPETSWFRPYAAYVAQNALVTAAPGNLLKPDEAMNRGQIAELIFKLYQKKPELSADTREIVQFNAMDSSRVLITPENVQQYDQDHGADSPACQEQFSTSNDHQDVFFSSKSAGFSLKIPFNRLWGNEKYRVNPYDYSDGEISFGKLQKSESCGWARAMRMKLLPVRTPVSLLTELRKRSDINTLSSISINGIQMITYKESTDCSMFHVIVEGTKYYYQLSTCGTWEDVQPILQTMKLLDTPVIPGMHL